MKNFFKKMKEFFKKSLTNHKTIIDEPIISNKKKSVNRFDLHSISGERGSRTYAFKKYHKIANH